jgi:peptidoglycan/LPS O-acetylase OafA/YrhL
MDALALGGIVATLAINGRNGQFVGISHNLVIFATAAALVIAGLITRVFNTYDHITLTIGQTVLSIGFATIVWLVTDLYRSQQRHWLLRVLSIRILRSIGKFSFAMYVFHLPISIALEPFLARHIPPRSYSGVINTSVVTLCAYLAAFASYHLLEKHFLRLKKYFVAEAKDSRIHAG